MAQENESKRGYAKHANRQCIHVRIIRDQLNTADTLLAWFKRVIL